MSSAIPSTSSATLEDLSPEEHDIYASSDESSEVLSTAPKPSSEATSKRGRKDFVTPKLVSSLDRCQLSIRDSVYILQATVEALGLNFEDFPINKSSIQRVRTRIRKERAENIKTDFQNNVPEVVTVHWDGKLLPGLNVRSAKEERLPIVITFGDEEQLLSVPKLDNSSGKEQAKAVSRAIKDWNLDDKVQIICCDTTASNTGRFNGTCVLLEQELERELVLFGCRHHIYELVLKSVFETKVHQVTISPEIPLFKMFRDEWKNIDTNNFQTGADIVKENFNDHEITEILSFYFEELRKPIVRNDYRELTELSIIFLGGDVDKQLKIRPPGAMHQARWMARAIYALKIFLLRSQLKLTKKDSGGLKEVCVFIVMVYVKPWLQCSSAVKAPFQDLCFLKKLKDYEKVDESISKAAFQKLCQHLYYLTEETVVLSLFDDTVDLDTKMKMVANFNKESQSHSLKRYVPSKEAMCNSMQG